MKKWLNVKKDANRIKVLVLISICQSSKYDHAKGNVNTIPSNVHTFIQKMIYEEQERIIQQNCALLRLRRKNAHMVIVAANHIINMNNCTKRMFIENNFVHSLKIVVMECFVLLHIRRRI